MKSYDSIFFSNKITFFMTYQTIVEILINIFSLLFLILFLQFTYLHSLRPSGQKMTICFLYLPC